MEWVMMIIYAVNIFWAAVIDFAVDSYFNFGCGLVLGLTVPLPSSIGQMTPGYSIKTDGKRVDVVVPDNDWLWITVYTSWDLLFAWMYSKDIWGTLLHLGPPYLYCLLTGKWEMYAMVRVQSLYVYIQIAIPWNW